MEQNKIINIFFLLMVRNKGQMRPRSFLARVECMGLGYIVCQTITFVQQKLEDSYYARIDAPEFNSYIF